MSAISKKQAKTEDLHNYLLDAEIFRRTFNRYVRRFNTIFVTLAFLISAPFIARAIAWYLEMAKVDITSFLDLWYATESLLLDAGFPHIAFGIFASGIIAVGQNALGIISVGGILSFGIISIGMFCTCGIISVGGMCSVGIIAIGYARAYGIIAIAIGEKNIHQNYPSGQAFGVIAIGRDAHGVYSLSYGEKGNGTYQFSPKRQDPEAVALFTRWFKKFKDAFVLPS